jgi:DNA-binding CsgD family transcriptional regulator
VDGHRNNLLEKTGARNTAGLVIFAIKNNLVSPGVLL